MLLVNLISGDNGGSEGAIGGLIRTLALEPSFSRHAESTADEFAFDVLVKTDRSPEHLGLTMELLREEYQRRNLDEGNGFFISHPTTTQRIEAAKKAAALAGFAPLPQR
jgi:predicted Zn-dependent protease